MHINKASVREHHTRLRELPFNTVSEIFLLACSYNELNGVAYTHRGRALKGLRRVIAECKITDESFNLKEWSERMASVYRVNRISFHKSPALSLPSTSLPMHICGRTMSGILIKKISSALHKFYFTLHSLHSSSLNSSLAQLFIIYTQHFTFYYYY